MGLFSAREVFCTGSECGHESGFCWLQKVWKVLGRSRGKPLATGTVCYLGGSIELGRLENLLYSCLFHYCCPDLCFGLFCVRVVLVFFILWLPLLVLTAKSISLLLRKGGSLEICKNRGGISNQREPLNLSGSSALGNLSSCKQRVGDPEVMLVAGAGALCPAGSGAVWAGRTSLLQGVSEKIRIVIL